MTHGKTINKTTVLGAVLVLCSLCVPLNAFILDGNVKREKTPEELTPLTKEEIQAYRDKFKKLNTLLAEKKLPEFYLLSFELFRELIFASAPDKNKAVLDENEQLALLLLVANAPLVPFEKREEYIKDGNGIWPIPLLETMQKSLAAEMLCRTTDAGKTLSEPEKITRANAIGGVLKSFKSAVDAGSFEDIPEDITQQERVERAIKHSDYIAAKNNAPSLEASFFKALIRYFPGDFEKIKTYFKLAGYDEKTLEAAFSNAVKFYRIDRDETTEFLFKKFEEIKASSDLAVQKEQPKKE